MMSCPIFSPSNPSVGRRLHRYPTKYLPKLFFEFPTPKIGGGGLPPTPVKTPPSSGVGGGGQNKVLRHKTYTVRSIGSNKLPWTTGWVHFKGPMSSWETSMMKYGERQTNTADGSTRSLLTGVTRSRNGSGSRRVAYGTRDGYPITEADNWVRSLPLWTRGYPRGWKDA